MPLKISFEELDKLTDSYNDREIARLLNSNYATVNAIRNQYGIKTFTQKTGLVKIGLTGELRKKGSVRGAVRTDGLKENYFLTIDEPNKAYWLGMLFADGWVSYRNGVPKETGLAFKSTDIDHVYAFKNAVAYPGRVIVKENKQSLTKNKISELATVRITSQRFTLNAVNAGVIPRKSGQIVLTPSCKVYPASFLRGYFDGDGSLCKNLFTFICNSLEYANQINELIREHTGKTLKLTQVYSQLTNKQVARLTGVRKDKEILQWMYSEKGDRLPRKHQRFLDYWS